MPEVEVVPIRGIMHMRIRIILIFLSSLQFLADMHLMLKHIRLDTINSRKSLYIGIKLASRCLSIQEHENE